MAKRKYNEVSTVHNNMLNYRIKKWPADFVERIKKFLVNKRKGVVRLIKK